MQHLILLHGAIGNSQQLTALADALKDAFIIHNIDFPGHGGTAMPPSFSMELFCDHVLQYMESNTIDKADFFGYSMGGYVALYLASKHPQYVGKVITLATKFSWSESIAVKEVGMLQPDVIETKVPAFANALKERHAPNDWKLVLQQTAGLLQSLGENPLLVPGELQKIKQQCLLLLGDSDKMVSAAETQDAADHLPQATMETLPGTPHPIEQVDIAMLAQRVRHFLLSR